MNFVKQKQLIIVIVILLVLIGVGVVLFKQEFTSSSRQAAVAQTPSITPIPTQPQFNCTVSPMSIEITNKPMIALSLQYNFLRGGL